MSSAVRTLNGARVVSLQVPLRSVTNYIPFYLILFCLIFVT